jgi:signal peptidase II
VNDPQPTDPAAEQTVEAGGSPVPQDPSAADPASAAAIANPAAASANGNPAAAGPDPAAADPAPSAPRGKPQIALLAIIACAVLILDIVTKAIIVANMSDGESVRALGGLIYFSLYRNSGAAFSMATGMTWILAIVAIGVVALIIRMAPRLRSPVWAVCLGLILGGALGNLMDRIFRSPGVLRGHVVDFVSVFGPDGKYFAVFNLADSAITIGGILLVIVTLMGIDFDGHRATRGKRAAARAGSGGA